MNVIHENKAKEVLDGGGLQLVGVVCGGGAPDRLDSMIQHNSLERLPQRWLPLICVMLAVIKCPWKMARCISVDLLWAFPSSGRLACGCAPWMPWGEYCWVGARGLHAGTRSKGERVAPASTALRTRSRRIEPTSGLVRRRPRDQATDLRWLAHDSSSKLMSWQAIAFHEQHRALRICAQFNHLDQSVIDCSKHVHDRRQGIELSVASDTCERRSSIGKTITRGRAVRLLTRI